MTALDRLRREEQLIAANTWLRRLWPFGLAVLMFVGGFYLGVRRRAPSEQDPKTVEALKNVTDSLKAARAQNAVLAVADHHASAIAATSSDSVTVHTPTVTAAAAGVSVSANPTDSTVIIERPAPGGAVDSVRADTLANLPLPIATFIREAKPQLERLTVALHDCTVAGEVKDARIRELVRSDSLAQQQDSLHKDHEAHLEDERDSAYRRGLVKGLKVAGEAAVFIAGAVKLVRFIGK